MVCWLSSVAIVKNQKRNRYIIIEMCFRSKADEGWEIFWGSRGFSGSQHSALSQSSLGSCSYAHRPVQCQAGKNLLCCQISTNFFTLICHFFMNIFFYKFIPFSLERYYLVSGCTNGEMSYFLSKWYITALNSTSKKCYKYESLHKDRDHRHIFFGFLDNWTLLEIVFW